MNEGVTLEFQVHLTTGRTGQRLLKRGVQPSNAAGGTGRVPRLARLMALALRFEELVRQGEVRDFADIAALGQVTRARVSQIVNLLNLAPDIQEEILFLPVVSGERETQSERAVRAIAGEPDWAQQRRLWKDKHAAW
jgi:hypothetical protein